MHFFIYTMLATGQGLGDINNAVTTANIYATILKDHHTVEQQTLNEADTTLENIWSTVQQHPENQYLIIGAGPKAAKLLQSHPLSKPDNLQEIIWTGHQPTQELLAGQQVSTIFLPQHVITADLEKDERIQALPCVIAPLANQEPSYLSAGWSQLWRCCIPNTQEIIIMLGGDADSPNNSHEHWLIPNAWGEQFAKKIQQAWPSYNIIIVNGPRTGKYAQTEQAHIDPFKPIITHEETRNNHHQAPFPYDPLSQTINDALTKEGMHVEVWHFWKNNEGTVYSRYDEAMERFLKNPKAILITCADSASDTSKNVSHYPLLHKRHNIYVTLTPSTTPALANIAKKWHDSGYFGLINTEVTPCAETKDTPMPINPFHAVTTSAHALLKKNQPTSKPTPRT
tara:strand:- start:1268 stop:2458 length:1191 start_codon:yes stop_codon:yes gene_type:complete